MEHQDKTELFAACRQYTDAKFRLRRIFPSLSTLEEIDNIATLIVDVASTNMTQALANKPQRSKPVRLKHVIDVAPTPPSMTPPKAFSTGEAADLFLERVEVVLRANKHGKATPGHIIASFQKRGWKLPDVPTGRTPKQFVSDTLMANTNLFTTRGRGVFGVRKRGITVKKVKAKNVRHGRTRSQDRDANVPPLEVFNVIESQFAQRDFTSRDVATKLGVHPYRVRGSFTRLHRQGFIVPKGAKGVPERPWSLSPKSKKLNGGSAKAVAETFPAQV